jgi:hypothetical protein
MTPLLIGLCRSIVRGPQATEDEDSSATDQELLEQINSLLALLKRRQAKDDLAYFFFQLKNRGSGLFSVPRTCNAQPHAR